ncbi:MAG: substrate-binding domain-containing protein, partial [Bacteroidia bacterium]|nr:substrate-binding domain-containing protein [Bacteroidia bacterium]
VGKLRTQGYIEALEGHEITLDGDLILKIDDGSLYEEHFEALEKDIEQLLKTNNQIDGVFAVNELYAITAMKVAGRLGLKIPDDIQVIGFTDGVLSKHATPSLATVSQHDQIIGEKAAEMLIQRLEIEDDENESEEHYQTLVVPTELIERNSTK